MTTFEEDLVDIYYNLLDYFTIKNIEFSSQEKRKGGKGRGEIDILAVQVKNSKGHCLWIEVSVSITTHFPFSSDTNKNLDESGKLLRKFFSESADKRIKEIIGDTPYHCILICSDLRPNFKKNLKERIPDFGGEIISLVDDKRVVLLEVKYKGKTKLIEIRTFTSIFFKLMKLFQEKGLLQKNFQDTRLRAIQHFLHIVKKRDDLKELQEGAKKDLLEKS